VVDLGAVLGAAYERGNLARRIDYASEPVPPLAGDEAAWADGILHSAGLR
jgi:hypothetical protein